VHVSWDTRTVVRVQLGVNGCKLQVLSTVVPCMTFIRRKKYERNGEIGRSYDMHNAYMDMHTTDTV
jgi:hypothetical protein